MGSFVNALVWRIHTKKDWVKARSQCPDCKHQLSARDLVPVLSWIELRGRCRYCYKPISWQYPAVELSMAAVFVVSYLYWPYDFTLLGIAQFALWLIVLVLLVALFVYDLRWMLLPNKLVYPLLGLVIILSGLSLPGSTDLWPALNICLGSLALGGLFWVLFQVSGGKWIGGGDVRIGFAIGALAGSLLNATLLLFIASLLGSLVSIPIILSGKKATHKVPFGPFLIAATIIVYLFGANINFWYQQLLYPAMF